MRNSVEQVNQFGEPKVGDSHLFAILMMIKWNESGELYGKVWLFAEELNYLRDSQHN